MERLDLGLVDNEVMSSDGVNTGLGAREDS